MPPDRCPVCLSACPFCPVCLSVTLVYCIQTVGGSNETWHGGRPLPGRIVSDGDAVPSEGYSPTFRPHVCCGQMAGWIKVSLGTEIDLEPGDIVLDGDHLPPPQKKMGHNRPYLSAHVLWPDGWTDQYVTWCGDRLRPRQHCARWGPSFAARKGHSNPLFLVHVYCGQMVAHLTYC